MGTNPLSNYGKSQQYKYAARAEISKAEANKSVAYRQANNLEAEAISDSYMAAENMSRTRANQNAATSTARTMRGASGFTDEGSATQPEMAIADVFEQAINDMSLSNAINDQNKRFAATTTRYQGDLGMMAGEQTASQMRQLGDNAMGAMYAQVLATIAGGGIGGIGGAYMGSAMSNDLLSSVPGAANQNSGLLSMMMGSYALDQLQTYNYNKTKKRSFSGFAGRFTGVK